MTNDRKWSLQPIDPSMAIANAMRMGPGPYYAVPIAFFTSQDERTQYALALWIPELAGVATGSLSAGELANLASSWAAQGRKIMVRPLYVGPQGLEFKEEDQRPYQRRTAKAMEAVIWRLVSELILALEQSHATPAKSWQQVTTRQPKLAGFWDIEN